MESNSEYPCLQRGCPHLITDDELQKIDIYLKANIPKSLSLFDKKEEI